MMAFFKEPLTLLIFNDLGENISLVKTCSEASWCPRQSGSYIYSNQCLQPKNEYLIQIQGSGHVDIGIVTTNPNDIDPMRRDPSFRRTNEVKVHKRDFVISMKLQSSEVTSKYQNDVYKIKLEKDKSAWIAIYPKFGDITASIKYIDVTGTFTKPMILSRTVGNNIRLEEDDTKALTIHTNPAAICSPSFMLKLGHVAVFRCSPLIELDKTPSRFHLKIMASKENPKKFVQSFRSVFYANEKKNSEPPWAYIDMLDKNVCVGNIHISLKPNNMLTCSIDNFYNKEMSLPFDVSSGLWLIFELYRVSLRMVSVRSSPVLQDACAGIGADGASGTEIDDTQRKFVVYNGEENIHVGQRNALYQSLRFDSFDDQSKCASGFSPEMSVQTSSLEIMQRLECKVDALSSRMDGIDTNVSAVVQEIYTRRSAGEAQSPDEPSASSTTVKLNFRKNLVRLVDDLNANDVIDHWFQENIINKNLYQMVQAQSNTRDANRLLLMELLGKTVERAVFEKTLKNSEQEYLLDLFLPKGE